MEENANKLHFLITSNIVIHPQILIFSLLKIYVGTFWDTVYIRNMALSFTLTGFARWLLLIVVYNMTRSVQRCGYDCISYVLCLSGCRSSRRHSGRPRNTSTAWNICWNIAVMWDSAAMPPDSFTCMPLLTKFSPTTVLQLCHTTLLWCAADWLRQSETWWTDIHSDLKH